MKEEMLAAFGAVKGFLPAPKGCKVLIGIPRLSKRTAKGIELPDELINREEAAATIALVVEVGPDAYKDERMFPSGAYCKQGDWVVMRPYSGTRLRVEGCEHEFRLVNDNTIEGTVEDPTFLMRAHAVVSMRRVA